MTASTGRSRRFRVTMSGSRYLWSRMRSYWGRQPHWFLSAPVKYVSACVFSTGRVTNASASSRIAGSSTGPAGSHSTGRQGVSEKLTSRTPSRRAISMYPDAANASQAVWRSPSDSPMTTWLARVSRCSHTAAVTRGSVLEAAVLSATAVQRFGLTTTVAPRGMAASQSHASRQAATAAATPASVPRRATMLSGRRASLMLSAPRSGAGCGSGCRRRAGSARSSRRRGGAPPRARASRRAAGP